MIRAVGAVHNSVAIPSASFQMPPLPVVREMGTAIETSEAESPIGRRQRVRLGLAIVAANRLPSPLPASDVYRSRPELSLCAVRRSTSTLWSDGPDPSGPL